MSQQTILKRILVILFYSNTLYAESGILNIGFDIDLSLIHI